VADLHQQRVIELARRNAQRYSFRYRSLLLHWLGRAFRRPAPVEVAPPPPVESGQVSVTWGGHATALIRYHRVSVLCDPVLSRAVSGVRRELAPGLGLESLTDVDLVLVTHAAPDHLDVATLARLSRGATVVVPPHAGARVSPLGFARLVELSAGTSFDHRGLSITAEEVRHGDRASPAQSYVLRGDGPTVYFCGASGYFPGFGDIGRRHWPDVALLPIAGYRPPSFRDRHMSPLDALYAFEDLRARVMVPIGYGTFALSYERLNDPERWLAELVSERHLERFVVRLGPGESRVFVPPGASGFESNRFEVGMDSDGQTEVAPMMPLRPTSRPVISGRRTLPPLPPPLEADALTVPGGSAALAAAVMKATSGTPHPPRLPPALIVDHDGPDDRDGETGIYDRTGVPHARDAQSSDEDDEEEEEAATRAIGLDMADPDSEPVPLPLPGSR
jgi:L-ascorbate metabolism protein UlaG (beta-lactamase superfamily)